MRLQITHLKAPWPLGAVVGDVLDLPSIPAWAVGKCAQVGDDVELTIVDNRDYIAPIEKQDEALPAPVFVVNPAEPEAKPAKAKK
ncbi:MAG: hypothetical protein KBG00_07945 [Rhodoferax sp.]|jgi:hypothetical protein|uniref:hypothetical protein n=1 Tax=Rhodoferax sp. TaxID=50421 RepID=UPI001B3EF554|nr:hypothetical protein [Rhodoferax sp.]MBP9148700.1 hypothetical protein [Rhodoferax sp.]MBP9736266.1 hypothetical protein [Rhodoferax sp.]